MSNVVREYKKHVPCDETYGKAFQMDDYGNFRIGLSPQEKVINSYVKIWNMR